MENRVARERLGATTVGYGAGIDVSGSAISGAFRSARADPRGLHSVVPRGIVVSDSAVLRAGIAALMPDRGVDVIGELDGPTDLLRSVLNTNARIVIAAPVDSGDSLFDAIAGLPGRCSALVLLAVPSFRIQATMLTNRLDVRCLPMTVTREALKCAVEGALGGESPILTVAEVASGPRGQLTSREQEVLTELTLGKGNQEIADKLWITPNTVKSHLRKIYRKLGVETRSEAVALYVGQLGSA